MMEQELRKVVDPGVASAMIFEEQVALIAFHVGHKATLKLSARCAPPKP